jgi:hypothetical protein
LRTEKHDSRISGTKKVEMIATDLHTPAAVSSWIQNSNGVNPDDKIRPKNALGNSSSEPGGQKGKLKRVFNELTPISPDEWNELMNPYSRSKCPFCEKPLSKSL